MISIHQQSMPIEISELVKSILTIDPLHRKEEDIDRMIEDGSLIQLSFIKDVFKPKTTNNLRSFLKCLKIFHLNPNEEVYKIGDRPKNCFFLLDGELDIFVPEIKRILNTTQFVIEHKRAINQGEIFGEKELATPSSLRESTVNAKTSCLIGKLSKRDYFKIYDTLIRKFQHDYLGLFKNMKLFKSKGKEFIEKFVREMIVRDYSAGEQILYQDKPCNLLYIIKSGSVKVVNEKSSESYYSFDYNMGEMFGDIEIFFNKPFSLFSIYSGDNSCQLFCCQRDAFTKLLGAFVSEFNSLTQTKIERIKSGIGELTKTRLFCSRSVSQLASTHFNISIKAEEEANCNDYDVNKNDNYSPDFNHFHYKDNSKNDIEYFHVKPKQTNNFLYKKHHFFRKPMKSITAISSKINACQKLRAREIIIRMVPMPKINTNSRFIPFLNQDNKSSKDIYQDAAVNIQNQIPLNLDQNYSSHLSRSSTLSSFGFQRNDKKKYTHELNNLQMMNTQIKLTPKIFQSQMLRRTSLTKKFGTNREKILSLFSLKSDLLRSNL